MKDEKYIEYLKYKNEREKDFNNAFELNHFWGDEYPEITSKEIDKICKNEWKLKQLETNWNQLKKLLEERIKYYKEIGYDNTYLTLQIVLNKMQELEGNNEN